MSQGPSKKRLYFIITALIAVVVAEAGALLYYQGRVSDLESKYSIVEAQWISWDYLRNITKPWLLQNLVLVGSIDYSKYYPRTLDYYQFCYVYSPLKVNSTEELTVLTFVPFYVDVYKNGTAYMSVLPQRMYLQEPNEVVVPPAEALARAESELQRSVRVVSLDLGGIEGWYYKRGAPTIGRLYWICSSEHVAVKDQQEFEFWDAWCKEHRKAPFSGDILFEVFIDATTGEVSCEAVFPVIKVGTD